MIIDKTYFVRGLLIAQLGDPVAGNDAVADNYIATHEPEFLKKALGYAFYKLMTANLADARFQLLMNGAEYSIPSKGITDKWEGFVNAGKRSPIANYVYFKYWEDAAQATGGIGIMVSKADKADRVSPAQKMVQAWDDMRSLLRTMYQFLYANRSTYPEFDIAQTDPFRPVNIYNL